MRTVEKPWGAEFIWAETTRYAGKILKVHAGQALSLQRHALKDETLMLLKGSALLDIGNSVHEMKPNEPWRIQPATIHRIRAIEYSEILEVSSPELEDIERLEDRYGRIPEKKP